MLNPKRLEAFGKGTRPDLNPGKPKGYARSNRAASANLGVVETHRAGTQSPRGA